MSSDEVEIRIAAYATQITEGPCMRSSCINRLRRIVELEDALTLAVNAFGRAGETKHGGVVFAIDFAETVLGKLRSVLAGVE